MKNSPKSNLKKNYDTTHPLLLELDMTPEDFEKNFGISFDEFDDDVDLSIHELLEELDLLDDDLGNNFQSYLPKPSLKNKKSDSKSKINNSTIKEDNNIDSKEPKTHFSLYQSKKSKNNTSKSKNRQTNQNKDDESISDSIHSVRNYFEENRFIKNTDKEIDKIRTIAVACEIAPAKTIIPVLKLLRKFESEKKLNWEKTRIIGLVHGDGASELIKPYCDDIYYIGQGRRANQSNNSRINLFRLIIIDIYKATLAMMGEQIDLLVTCGNAGDVRKAISAAKLLRTPVLHIEQDIYNPIEIISHANLITTPSKDYEFYLKIQYSLKNVVNIGGYPQASYVNSMIQSDKLLTKDQITEQYGFDHYIFVVLGGDLKVDDLKDLIPLIDGFDYPTLIAPYRFDKKMIEDLSRSDKVKILDNFVDVLSLSYHCDALIFGAGMGMTIEAGVLKVPSIKLYGFHPFHSSINLAKDLNIPIVQIYDIPRALKKLYPPSGDLVSDGEIATYNILNLINNFDYSLKKGNIKSTFKLWRGRSKFKKGKK
ncbi:hypothetical protein [uncultured Methanobrevibacter sp.]|uniref:hypothetical protein n=1 Tax=uncultured Methanobrevibacter sp. TaxID=253161 RepID=UPI0025EEFEDA|nr:hypothetical protein [uncultured Methanobrevibacter sp.]